VKEKAGKNPEELAMQIAKSNLVKYDQAHTDNTTSVPSEPAPELLFVN